MALGADQGCQVVMIICCYVVLFQWSISPKVPDRFHRFLVFRISTMFQQSNIRRICSVVMPFKGGDRLCAALRCRPIVLQQAKRPLPTTTTLSRSSVAHHKRIGAALTAAAVQAVSSLDSFITAQDGFFHLVASNPYVAI